MLDGGDWEAAVDAEVPGAGFFLRGYPPITKFLALRAAANAQVGAEDLLYLDNDTVCLTPLDRIWARREADVVAREMVECVRSPLGHRADQVDAARAFG